MVATKEIVFFLELKKFDFSKSTKKINKPAKIVLLLFDNLRWENAVDRATIKS